MKADIVNYNQEPVSRTVNPPRSSVCAIQWARFPSVSRVLAALGSGGRRAPGAVFSQCPSVVQLALSSRSLHPASLSVAQPQAAPRTAKIPPRDHTLWVQNGSRSLGSDCFLEEEWRWFSRCPHFYSDVNFLKQIWKLSKSRSQPGFCHSTTSFSYLSSFMATCAAECRHVNK